jgi:hypothetical protein
MKLKYYLTSKPIKQTDCASKPLHSLQNKKKTRKHKEFTQTQQKFITRLTSKSLNSVCFKTQS